MINITINEKDLLTLLQDMIRIESVNPKLSSSGNGEYVIANYLGNYLTKMGIEINYQPIEHNRVNVVGVLKGRGGGRALMLNGHTDTVGISGMDIEPLNPVFKDGKVYGRGSLDMKSGLAALIIAVKSIIDSGLNLRGDVLLTFVTDEEYRSLGTETLIKEYSADAAIISEPTDLQICIAHKGFAWINVEIFGRAAHGSKPDKGIDAIVKAGKFLVEIENLSKHTLVRKKHQLLGSPTIHASLIKGGNELSTYPNYCKIELERRTIPGESIEIIEDEIKTLIDKMSIEDEQFKAKFDVFFHRSSLEVSKDQLVVDLLAKAYYTVLNHTPEFIGLGGWMDSAILAEAGIPTIIFGPSGEGLHANVEYVDFNSVLISAKIFAYMIIEFCGI